MSNQPKEDLGITVILLDQISKMLRRASSDETGCNNCAKIRVQFETWFYCKFNEKHHLIIVGKPSPSDNFYCKLDEICV